MPGAVGTCVIFHCFLPFSRVRTCLVAQGEGQYFNECVMKECWDRFVYKRLQEHVAEECGGGSTVACSWNVSVLQSRVLYLYHIYIIFISYLYHI